GTFTQSLTPSYYAIRLTDNTIRLAINQVNALNFVFLALPITGGSFQSLVPTGQINTATGNGLTAINTVSGAINSGGTNAVTQSGTNAGQAAFANLQIFTSFSVAYSLQALFTNPNGQSVAIGSSSTNPFFVLPAALGIVGSNFAAFGQTLFNITIV